jgi:hypothetical protein
MAQEFFDYQERDIDKLPDWSKVTGDISDKLVRIQKERQAKRDEQDRKTQESLTALEDIDMGESQTMNELKLKAVEDSKRYLLEQEKLMKQNKLDPNQRLIALQTQMDDWKAFSNVTNEWDKNYSEYLTRMEEDASAGMEQAMAEWNEEFGNIANKAVKTNNENGRLYLTTTDGSGEPLSINALNNRLKDRVNKYDVNGEVQNQVQKLGQVVKVINKDGIMSMDDVRKNPAYEEAKKKMVEALLGSDRDTSSILSDYVGGYSFTRDKSMQGKEDENGNEMILLTADKNGTYQPEFTKTQKDKAKEYVDLQLEMQLGFKETPKAPEVKSTRNPNQWEVERSDKKRKTADLFNTAIDVAEGNESVLERVYRNTNVKSILKQGDIWTIQFDNNQTERLKSGGNTIEDAKMLFDYTVGPVKLNELGANAAEDAYKEWERYGDKQVGKLAGDFGSLADYGIESIYDVNMKDGSNIYESISETLNSKSSLASKVSDLNYIFSQMQLPSGVVRPEVTFKYINGNVSYSINGEPKGFVKDPSGSDVLEAVNTAIENSLAQQGGGMAGF